GGIDGRGQPNVPAPECKAFGHDANPRGALVIQEEVLAYNIRVEPEPAEPHLITKNEDGRCAGLPVAGNNTAAEQRRDAEKLERVVAHRVGVEGLQPIARAHE